MNPAHMHRSTDPASTASASRTKTLYDGIPIASSRYQTSTTQSATGIPLATKPHHQRFDLESELAHREAPWRRKSAPILIAALLVLASLGVSGCRSTTGGAPDLELPALSSRRPACRGRYAGIRVDRRGDERSISPGIYHRQMDRPDLQRPYSGVIRIFGLRRAYKAGLRSRQDRRTSGAIWPAISRFRCMSSAMRTAHCRRSVRWMS